MVGATEVLVMRRVPSSREDRNALSAIVSVFRSGDIVSAHYACPDDTVLGFFGPTLHCLYTGCSARQLSRNVGPLLQTARSCR